MFNIVVEVGLFSYLGDALLPRLHLLYAELANPEGVGLAACLLPLIWLRRIPVLTKQMVEILIAERLPRKAISYLLCNMDPDEN